MRNILGAVVGALLVITGKRFSKRHRQEETLVYLLINTVKANRVADRIAKLLTR